ncbi:MAG: NUDIX hydrolase, partial [Candidatus Nanoarchaeia archaeon]
VKVVHAWAFEGDWNGLLRQNMIKIRWPPKVGNIIEIPEVDKANFFNIKKAKEKIIPAQFEFVERLREKLGE